MEQQSYKNVESYLLLKLAIIIKILLRKVLLSLIHR